MITAKSNAHTHQSVETAPLEPRPKSPALLRADAFVARAEKAGAKVTMPVGEMFWGDRYGILIDPFGHSWSLATTVKKMSFEDMQAAAKEMSKGPCPEAEQTADAAKA